MFWRRKPKDEPELKPFMPSEPVKPPPKPVDPPPPPRKQKESPEEVTLCDMKEIPTNERPA